MVYIWMTAGVLLLIVGGELLVRNASAIAERAGISPLLIGLTIVAFGTSAPELITSITGRLAGESSLAVGNVVGSNIFNVFFILGIAALVTPLRVRSELLKTEVPLVIGTSLLAAGFAYSGFIEKREASILFAILGIYSVWVVRQTRREVVQVREEYREATQATEPGRHWAVSLALIALGFSLLIFGGKMFVGGAVDLARLLGVEETVIGLTIVAAGTSLPEVATSVLASIRGHRDIAVGNIVGSNLFNLTAVLGLSGILGAGGLAVPESVLRFDLPVMIAAAVVCLPVMATGRRIGRLEAFVFVVYFGAYTTFVVLNATSHVGARSFGTAVVWFAVPLSAVTLAVIGYREMIAPHPDDESS